MNEIEMPCPPGFMPGSDGPGDRARGGMLDRAVEKLPVREGDKVGIFPSAIILLQ